VHEVYRTFFLIGVYEMMVGFGALFANTIMARVGFLIGICLQYFKPGTIRCLNSACACYDCHRLRHEKIAKGKPYEFGAKNRRKHQRGKVAFKNSQIVDLKMDGLLCFS